MISPTRCVENTPKAVDENVSFEDANEPSRHWARTKIVATIGPASRDPKMLAKLVKAGVDVFRLNFSHGTHDIHRGVVDAVRAASREVERDVAILGDLCGPKIRLGRVRIVGNRWTRDNVIRRTFRDGALPVELVFFDCSDDVLKRRFSETRRPHPIGAKTANLEEMRRSLH